MIRLIIGIVAFIAFMLLLIVIAIASIVAIMVDSCATFMDDSYRWGGRSDV